MPWSLQSSSFCEVRGISEVISGSMNTFGHVLNQRPLILISNETCSRPQTLCVIGSLGAPSALLHNQVQFLVLYEFLRGEGIFAMCMSLCHMLDYVWRSRSPAFSVRSYFHV